MTERTCFICGNYVYWGMPANRMEIGDENIHLIDCYIIYDTGKWSDPEWKIVEHLGNWSVAKSAVESWGVINKRLPAGATSAATPAKTTTADQSQSPLGGSLLVDGAADYLDTMEFFELCQAYRQEPAGASKPFEALKEFIRAHR